MLSRVTDAFSHADNKSDNNISTSTYSADFDNNKINKRPHTFFFFFLPRRKTLL